MPSNRSAHLRRSHWSSAAMFVAYVAVITAVVVALLAARRWALERLDNPRAVAQWEQWRDDEVRRAREPEGVARQPPVSSEPPELILLRDHFPAIVVSTSIVVSFLYAFLVITLRGAWRSSGRAPEESSQR